MTKPLKILALIVALGFVAFSCWITATSQDVVSRRTTATVSYTTVMDTIDSDNRDGYSVGIDERLSYDEERIFVGNDGPGLEDVGFEFALAVPKDATVDSCFVWLYLRGTSYLMDNADTLQWGVYDVDNAAVYDSTHTHRISAHHALTDSIDVVFAAPGTEGWVKSPNLASILQPVVNRAGWSSGNYAGFPLYSRTVAAGHDFAIEAWLDTEGPDLPYIKVVYH